MALSPAAGGGDLFLTGKGKLSRARGRRKDSPNRWTPPSPVIEREGTDAARLLDHRQNVIRAMLANQGFEIVFQPIVDLRTGGVAGAEALTRFETSPARPPDVWFAEAREIGLGVDLEMAALRSALVQLRRLPAGLYLSLNASPDTMMSAEFRALVADAPAERIVLELTEHDSIDDYEVFEKTTNELRSYGARLAVDDAGAGFSSLRHILNLHPDIIKLDIGLTRGIDADPARRALGSAMLDFGLQAFDAAIVAEGIETEGEFKTLRGLGCRFGQGFYLGRPGRLRPAHPQPTSSERRWHSGELEAESTSVEPIEVDYETWAQSSPGTQADKQRVSASSADPIRPEPEDVRVLRQREQPRDTRDELLALVAEMQPRPGDADDAWKGDRSRVGLLRRG